MSPAAKACLAKLRGEIPAAASHPLMPPAGRESLLTLLQLAEWMVSDLDALDHRISYLELIQKGGK